MGMRGPTAEQVHLALREEIETLEERLAQLRKSMMTAVSEVPTLALRLTGVQRELLRMIVKANGKVVRTDALLSLIGSAPERTKDGKLYDENNLRVQVSYMRKKLAPHGIRLENVWGVGYFITAADIRKLKALAKEYDA